MFTLITVLICVVVIAAFGFMFLFLTDSPPEPRVDETQVVAATPTPAASQESAPTPAGMLQAQGRPAAPAPAAGMLQFNTASVDFGSTLVSSTAKEVVLLSNTGGMPVALTTFSFTDVGFAVDGSECLDNVKHPGELQPNETCRVTLSYQPDREGPATRKLTVFHSGGGGPAEVTMHGYAVAASAPAPDLLAAGAPRILVPTVLEVPQQPKPGPAAFELSANRLEFTQAGSPVSVTLTNVSENDLAISVQAGGYDVSNGCRPRVAPGATCDIAFTYPLGLGRSRVSATVTARPSDGGRDVLEQRLDLRMEN